MCKKLQILNRSKNGLLIYCKHNQMYQLLYNNLNFNFTEDEFESFHKYLFNVEVEYWEEEFKHSIYDKRIPIPTIQSNLLLLLNKQEVTELKSLIKLNPFMYKKLEFSDINYKLFPN
ncbi:hypothetical protein OOZ15_11165 [Galbibacter sp. EGI 63066]|uniref:DUF6686 family protein n=1 Tax=Galbibacter sp. EGI 63066 TaxID=2993559 RepID=UPI00224893AB|nr:DUF6686 family protein [Galbibacter sp. EGI 63066]MCX2680502.1 hypothetical protein [Galbibacter sp. EGI 63066]